MRIKRQQHGAVLLILVISMSAVALLWLYSSWARHDNGERTQFALHTAQSALLGRAVADANRPGSLPCPDTNNDGVAELLAGVQCPNYLGRLPWRTLGLSDIRDGSGERLWYALSADMRDASGNIINSAVTVGQLQMNASPQQVAIVFAPNVALTNQSRDSAQQNTASLYLDASNADGDKLYESDLYDTVNFNDQIHAISQTQLFTLVEKHALQQFAVAIGQYDTAHHAYPYAANASGDMQTGQLSGTIPYNTLNLATSAWAQNHWFDNLSAVPYQVNTSLDSLTMQLRYCQANLTRGQPLQVQCG
jgi:hypothetical protein